MALKHTVLLIATLIQVIATRQDIFVTWNATLINPDINMSADTVILNNLFGQESVQKYTGSIAIDFS